VWSCICMLVRLVFFSFAVGLLVDVAIVFCRIVLSVLYRMLICCSLSDSVMVYGDSLVVCSILLE